MLDLSSPLTVFKLPSTSQKAIVWVLTVTGLVKRTASANAFLVDIGVWFNGDSFGDLGVGECDSDLRCSPPPVPRGRTCGERDIAGG